MPGSVRGSARKGRPYRDRRATHDAHCDHAKMPEAKFWLKPVALARAGRLKPVDLQEIERIIEDNQDFLWRAWKKEQSKRANR